MLRFNAQYKVAQFRKPLFSSAASDPILETDRTIKQFSAGSCVSWGRFVIC